MSDKIILVTGGFDPLHSGHIEYIKAARQLGRVVVGVNSDAWLTRKKGQPFMPFEERLNIMNNLRDVMTAIGFDDSDGSAKDAIGQVRKMFPNNTIVFANGGDRTKDNIPEMTTEVNNVEFVFGIGGQNKMNSSSWILQEWKAPKTERQWGYYRVLHEVQGMKVKELIVEPGKSLSMQRHQHRAEYWIVSEGKCIVNSTMPNGYALPCKELSAHDEYKIPVHEWHQLTNPYDVPCKIVEIQYGQSCEESDIQRL
jgi:cytidyltransferase-like protein